MHFSKIKAAKSNSRIPLTKRNPAGHLQKMADQSDRQKRQQSRISEIASSNQPLQARWIINVEGKKVYREDPYELQPGERDANPLEHTPTDVLTKIIDFLPIGDVGKLPQVSKQTRAKAHRRLGGVNMHPLYHAPQTTVPALLPSISQAGLMERDQRQTLKAPLPLFLKWLVWTH